MNAPAPFAELVSATNYSFLRGASHPAAMVHRAAALGMAGVGIADRNSVAGVVRAHMAYREIRSENWCELAQNNAGFRLVVGSRLVFADDTPDIIAYPVNRTGWGRLTRLLTVGNRRAVKGDCILHFTDLIEYADDLLLIVMGGKQELLTALNAACPGNVWLGASMHRFGADERELARLIALSAVTDVPLLATNDALYATPDTRALHDIMTCICEGTNIQKAGKRLLVNAERHLKIPPKWRGCSAAVRKRSAQLPICFHGSTSLSTSYAMNIPTNKYPKAGKRRNGWSIWS